MSRIEGHIVKKYDQQLGAIRSKILEMGGMVEAQIQEALRSLDQQDIKLAQQVIKNDKKINQIDLEIGAMATELVALRAPMASDLRLITAISKAATDLERIGDECEKIAHMVLTLFDISEKGENLSFNVGMLRDVESMAKLALEMLKHALDAFARQDMVLANKVIESDHELDEAFNDGIRRLITYMMEDPRNISPFIDVIFVLKAIERIGDHAANIAEYVLYIVNGIKK